jgi:hypothetical protein
MKCIHPSKEVLHCHAPASRDMHELVYSTGMSASMEKKSFAPHMVGSNKCVVINLPTIQEKATHAYNNTTAGVAGK